MKKLHELLAKKPLKGDVGIEIECEGHGFREVHSELWRCEDDGSLRGRFPNTRIEYILEKPIPVDTVKHAVTELVEMTKGAVPDFSFRTSVHVHVNVLDLTSDQIISLIYTYLLLEEAMINYCGSVRKCNRFCLRLQDADEISKNLIPVFKKGVKQVLNLDQELIRYSSLNLAAIKKYGSVEFRGMRGTMDVNTIDVWCNALVSIRNFACHFENVLAIHDAYIEKGAEGFLSFVLGDLATHFKYKNLVKDMQRSYSLSIDLPYAFNNKIEEKEEEEEGPIEYKPIAPMPRADGFAPRRPRAPLGVRLAEAQAGAIPAPQAIGDLIFNQALANHVARGIIIDDLVNED